VGAVVIVEMEPPLERLGALCVGAVDPDVGPLFEEGAVEALNLPVGLRSAGSGERVGGSGECLSEGIASIARAVVGQDPFDADAVVGEPAVGSDPELGGGEPALVS
jgi:hypothetical protein